MAEIIGAEIIGVVLAACNVGPWVTAALDSVRTQDDSDWRLIAVDDGSTDNTADLLQHAALQDARITVLSQANQGLSAARNAGMAALPDEAAFLLLLDGDDVLLPGALTVLRATLAGDVLIGGAWGTATVIDSDGNDAPHLWPFPPPPPEGRYDFRAIAERPELYPPSRALWRRCVADAAGPFDVAQISVEDWDWYARASLIAPLRFVNVPVTAYRRRGTNLTNDRALMAAGSARARRKMAAYRCAWTLTNRAYGRAGERV